MPADGLQQGDFETRTTGTEMVAASKARVTTTVLVDGKKTELPIQTVRFFERAFEHYELAVTLAPDLESADTLGMMTNSAEFLKVIGKSIVIKIKADDEYVSGGPDVEQREFQGTIYDVSFDFRGDYTNLITLHGISNTFRLDQAVKNKINLSVKRSDIAKEFIGEAGMNADVASSKTTEDYVVCYNETRWDFLKRFARSEGNWMYSDGDKVVITSKTGGKSIGLKWGTNLGGLRTRIKTRGLNTVVRGWDYDKKQEIVEQGSLSTELTSAAKEAKRESGTGLFAENSYLDINLNGLMHKDQLKAAAQARIGANLSRLVECVGQCNAPGLKVGSVVEIQGGGPAWNGKYFVKGVTHTITGEGYYNVFEALPIDVAHPEWQEPNPPINGFIPGIVTDLEDPDGLGRVKVKLPTIDDDSSANMETFWARLLSPYAGKERGMFFLPELDDEVMVGFERGDIQRPFVMGAFWNGKDTPSMAGAAGGAKDNDIKTIYTRSGHQMTFSDKPGQESIQIIDKSGGNLIIIDTREQKISVVSDKDVAVTAGKDISLTAKGDVSIEASNVNIKAKQGFKVEAMEANIKSKGMMTLEASGNAKLKGAMLDIDGGTVCGVKGGVIKLN